MPDPYSPGPHSSDDAPPMPRKPRGTRDPLLPSRDSAGTLRRVARALSCPECGKGFDLSRPADPRDFPPVEKARDELLLTYCCDEGHTGQVSTADLKRAIRADRAGKGPAYLAAFDGVFRVVLSALRRAHRTRDLEMVASLAEKATRMVALNLKLGGVLVEKVEVEHSGTVTVEQSAERVEAARQRVEELAARYGLGKVQDAEVVSGGRPPA